MAMSRFILTLEITGFKPGAKTTQYDPVFTQPVKQTANNNSFETTRWRNYFPKNWFSDFDSAQSDCHSERRRTVIQYISYILIPQNVDKLYSSGIFFCSGTSRTSIKFAYVCV